MELSDDEVEKMLRDYAIPQTYRRPDLRLVEQGELGAQANAWLTDFGTREIRDKKVFEFITQAAEGVDAFFMFARALALRQVPVYCVHAIEICPPMLNDDLWEAVESTAVLFVENLAPATRESFDTKQRACLEWFLGKWVGDGRSLVLLGERSIERAEEFNPQFRGRLKARTEKIFRVS